MSAPSNGLESAPTPRLVAAFIAIAAAASAAGYGAIATLGVPFLVGCLVALFGSPFPFIAILVGTSGLGFGWVSGASIDVGAKAVNASGLHWGLMAIVSVIVLARLPWRALPWGWKAYLAFVVLAALGIGWTPDPFEGIKLMLQFLVPLTVGALTLHVVRSWDDAERLRRFFWLGLFLALGSVAIVEAGALARSGAGGVAGTLTDRSLAIYLVPLLALSVASTRHRHPAFALLTAGILIIAAITLSRMVVATMLILILAASLGARMRTRVLLVMAALVLGLSVLQVPSFRARMFNSQRVGFGSGTVEVRGAGADAALAVGGLQLSGRGLLWLQTGRHALERPVLGWGTGASRHFLEHDVGLHIHHPHNDYLRVFHDLGVVGLAVLAAFGAAMLGSLLRIYRAVSTPRAREAVLAALLAWIGYLLIAVTDNVMVYPTFFTVNVFVLLAIAWRAREMEDDGAAAAAQPVRDAVVAGVSPA